MIKIQGKVGESELNKLILSTFWRGKTPISENPLYQEVDSTYQADLKKQKGIEGNIEETRDDLCTWFL